MSHSLETLLAVLVLTGLVVGVPLAYWAWVDRQPTGPDVGVAVFVEDCTMVHDCDGDCGECGAPMVVDEEVDRVLPPMVRTNLGFGRRNPHCSNCGDLRGGAFGHEASECKYRYGMTAGEVAAILPEHQRNEFWDEQIDRYFAEQERAL